MIIVFLFSSLIFALMLHSLVIFPFFGYSRIRKIKGKYYVQRHYCEFIDTNVNLGWFNDFGPFDSFRDAFKVYRNLWVL